MFYASCDAVFEDDLSGVVVDLAIPADGAQLGNSIVQFHWDSIKEALEYDFQLVTPSFSDSTAYFITDTTLSEFGLTRVLGIGEYEWRVKAINNSSESCFATSAFSVTELSNISGLTPVITAPEEGEFLNDEFIGFSWDTLPNASEYLLHVYDYTGQVKGDEVWSDIASEPMASEALDEGRFLFEIQGNNSGIQLSQIASSSFIVDRTSPSEPQVGNPNNQNFLLSDVIQFDWTSGADVASVVHDSIFIYTISPSQLVFSDSAESEFELPASDLGNGSYDWSIKTYDEAGNCSESIVQLFSIGE